MIFHLMLNSLLVFLILSLSIEWILFAFGIKSPRVRYIARLLPVIKLPFDLLVFAIYGDSLFLNLNPFSCEVYLQKFLMKFMPIEESLGVQSVVIPEFIANLLPPVWLGLVVDFSVVLSCLMFARKIIQGIRSRAYLKELFEAATPCNRVIFNHQLRKYLYKSKALILSSEQVHIPFVADRKNIFLPKDLVDLLSQGEFEAVIAHELEHLKWRDPLIRFSSNIICSIFWWIPTQWLLKQLEDDQEQASDLQVNKYGIDSHVFGSAFVKTIRNARYLRLEMAAICPFASLQNGHKKRLENILNWNRPPEGKIKLSVGIFLCSLTFFSFWMC